MIVAPRSLRPRGGLRTLLYLCILLLALGGITACEDDSTLGTNSDRTGQDTTTEDTRTEDTHTEDASAEDTQSPPDTDGQEDTSDEDADAQTSTDAHSDAEDPSDASDPSDAHATDAGTDAGDTLPPGACLNTQDCEQNGGGECVEPGGSMGCGACQNYLVTCTDDSDCAGSSSAQICERVGPEDCACDSGISICKPACSDNSECDIGEQCNPNGHCVAIPCSTSDSSSRACPHNFSCKDTVCPIDPPDQCQTCQRIECADNSDCGTSGVCVNGACYADPGSCQFPPP